MVKIFCYVMSAACAVLAVVSVLDMVDVLTMGLDVKDMGIGAIGCLLSLFLGRNVSHIERDEADRGGPSLRR